jgi:predicted dienelactone hydrolase
MTAAKFALRTSMARLIPTPTASFQTPDASSLTSGSELVAAARLARAVARCPRQLAIAGLVGVAVWVHGAGVAAAGGCVGDIDANGEVGGADLATLLSAWGGTDPAADLDGSGLIDAADLTVLLGAWGPCPATTPISTELASIQAAVAPYAIHVNSFNLGSNVQFAVHPLKFPDYAGDLVDVYLVANRSSAEWAASSTLSDVRGEPQTVNLPANPTTPNILLTMTGVTAGDVLSPGRGFDLVVDANRDGVLGDGDLIDGAGDEPGFWYVVDLAAAGPLAVTQIASYDVNDPDILDSMELERIYYPTSIASLDPRPLVVISHGNGHNYAWYDYLGNHLASWGYVVMSHQNDTVPGIETASTTTLEHTESFLAQLATIGGGVLNGRVDGDAIVWIGHSRGGEGIARGYDRLFDGTFTSPNYQIGDIRLLISIAPTDFLGSASANPHGVPFMLMYGSADGDVCGCPDSDIGNSFNILERAEGLRQSTYVHGADHNDFNCCGFNDFAGPTGTAIGNAEAQDVMKAASLAMIRRVVENDASAEEYLWRQYESLRPISVAASTTVINEWNAAPADRIVLDNFQTNTATTVSSSGGAVTLVGVANEVEGLQNDNNTAFTWATTDAMNGATRGRTTDLTRAFVFNWTIASSITWTVPADRRDFTQGKFLSMRAAQGTRHPQTTAVIGDLTFTVTLLDELGEQTSLQISAVGGGVEEPYQRTGFGTGTGWQNAMETIRLPLSAFVSGGSAIDLTRIESVLVQFGGTSGSAQGRLVIDDLQIEKN